MLTMVLSVDEAEEALKWGGLIEEGNGRYESHLAWGVVGCVHRNFLSPKSNLLSWSMDHGAHPHMRNQKQGTLLHECNDASLVDHLIHLGVDINATDDEEKTALYRAMLYGAWDVAGELIKHEASMFSPLYLPTNEERRRACAGLAILLCCEYYNSNPDFAPLVWNHLRPQFEWEDIQEHHRIFLADMSRIDLTGAPWAQEALDSLACHKRFPFHYKEKSLRATEVRGVSYYVSCDNGIRILFSNLQVMSLRLDGQKRNILHHAFEHFCFPLVRHIACHHPQLFRPDSEGNMPVSYMPPTVKSGLYTSFCPDLLLLGCLDAQPPRINTLPLYDILDMGDWPRLEALHQKKVSDIISSEAYNALLAEAVRERIHQQVTPKKSQITEVRKM